MLTKQRAKIPNFRRVLPFILLEYVSAVVEWTGVVKLSAIVQGYHCYYSHYLRG